MDVSVIDQRELARLECKKKEQDPLSTPPPPQATESLFLPGSPESWEVLSSMQREFTAQSRGVRMGGSAAANACALATGEACL